MPLVYNPLTVQLVDPAAEYSPAPHTTGAAVLSAHWDPAGHTVHATVPEEAAYVPAGHGCAGVRSRRGWTAFQAVRHRGVHMR